jgi:uncharacterized membrane protein YfcA
MEWELILSLMFFAFCAGTIDAAVGGGGLIQIPALMGALPNHHLQHYLEPTKLLQFVEPLQQHFHLCDE